VNKKLPLEQSRSEVMIRTGEIRKGNGQIQFSLTVLDTAQLRPRLRVGDAKPAPSFTRNEINLSGSQVLAGSLSALCTVGLLLWVIIRLWLFEY
jgi:hypothetical protein